MSGRLGTRYVAMSSSMRGDFAPHRFTSCSRSNAPSVSERGDHLQPATVFGVEVGPPHAGNDVGAIVNGHHNPVGGAAQPELDGRSAVEDGIGNKFVDHYYEIAGQVGSDCPSGQHLRSEPTNAGHGFAGQTVGPAAVGGKCADKVIDPVFDVASAMHH